MFDVAIVVPVFKHSVLLGEAVTSALAQEGPHEIAIVLVDDGCPFLETEMVCRAFAFANDNVFYLRKRNGGLSSARNHGIEFVMSRLPQVEAIFFLDADNRITPTMIRDTMAFLRAHPHAGWVYPNIDKMGIEWCGNYTAPYSKLTHILFDNICEAGSLVRRDVFAAGIRFDENMKDGFEDWDFWLQCVEKGFTGINFPYFGFEYRQRGESMVRDSNRQREAILGYMRKKHRALFRFDYLLALEHEEAPRYACIAAGSMQVVRFTDPRVPHPPLAFEEFALEYWRAILEPDTFGVPPFFAWMSEDALALLRAAGMANTVFLAAERLAESHHFVSLSIRLTERTYGLEERRRKEAGDERLPAQAWFTRFELFKACVDDPGEGWIGTIDQPEPHPDVVDLIVSVPEYAAPGAEHLDVATPSLFETLRSLKQLGQAVPRERWNWRLEALPLLAFRHTLLRDYFKAKPAANAIKQDSVVDVGVVLPVASFGGVEKVAYNVANVLKKHGYRLHLFIVGSKSYQEFPQFKESFCTINFLGGEYALWGGGHKFMGHDFVLGGDESAQLSRVVGLLLSIDVIITSQVAPLNAALGELRRHGRKVIGHFHVIDESNWGRQVGHPYLGLGFEHAYDLLLSCSQNLLDFFHGMGVPKAKLLHVPNAPSYLVSPSEVASIIARRDGRLDIDRLNVLCLGRLDRQKGVDRLYAAISEARSQHLPLNWLVVGGLVIEQSKESTWVARLLALGVEVRKPVYDEPALTELVADADVLLLTSRWEGAPLTILEAQRVGCIPMATDVGAISELIDHDVDGVLLPASPDGSIVKEIVQQLSDLIQNPSRRRRLTHASLSRGAHASWHESLRNLHNNVRAWFPGL